MIITHTLMLGMAYYGSRYISGLIDEWSKRSGR